MRRHTQLILTLAAATSLSTWGMAQNKPTTQPVPGGTVAPRPQPAPGPSHPGQTPRTGSAVPATQPAGQSSLQGESAKDAALPKEKHELHVALRHITIARDVLKETRDGGDRRVAAKTDLNLAIDALQKALGLPNTISNKDADKDNEPKKTPEERQAHVSALTGESEKDKAMPQENHELHVALRHATIGRDVLKVSKDGGNHRERAIEQTEDAMARIQQVLGLPVAKDKDRDKTPSAKTE